MGRRNSSGDIVYNGGNVGIGTDDPKSRLHIPQPSTTIGGNDIIKGAILVGDDNLGGKCLILVHISMIHKM